MVMYDSLKEWIGLHSDVDIVGLVYKVKLKDYEAEIFSRIRVEKFPEWVLELPCYDYFNNFYDVPCIKFLNTLSNFIYSGSSSCLFDS